MQRVIKTQPQYSSFIFAIKMGLSLAGVVLAVYLIAVALTTTDPLRAGLIFTDQETLDLAQEQKVTNPSFSGTSPRGDTFVIKATEARPNAPNPQWIDLIAPSTQINLHQNVQIKSHADKGTIDIEGKSVILSGGASMTMSNGIEASSDYIRMHLETGDVISPGKVFVKSNFGTLTAGSLQIINKTRGSGENGVKADIKTILLFKRGVELVYNPRSPGNKNIVNKGDAK